MPPGGPHDHPLTDIIHFQIPTYSPEADAGIRELSQLLSESELFEWFRASVPWLDWAPGKMPGRARAKRVERKVATKLEWARERAQESGWDVSQRGG